MRSYKLKEVRVGSMALLSSVNWAWKQDVPGGPLFQRDHYVNENKLSIYSNKKFDLLCYQSDRR